MCGIRTEKAQQRSLLRVKFFVENAMFKSWSSPRGLGVQPAPTPEERVSCSTEQQSGSNSTHMKCHGSFTVRHAFTVPNPRPAAAYRRQPLNNQVNREPDRQEALNFQVIGKSVACKALVVTYIDQCPHSETWAENRQGARIRSRNYNCSSSGCFLAAQRRSIQINPPTVDILGRPCVKCTAWGQEDVNKKTNRNTVWKRKPDLGKILEKRNSFVKGDDRLVTEIRRTLRNRPQASFTLNKDICIGSQMRGHYTKSRTVNSPVCPANGSYFCAEGWQSNQNLMTSPDYQYCIDDHKLHGVYINNGLQCVTPDGKVLVENEEGSIETTEDNAKKDTCLKSSNYFASPCIDDCDTDHAIDAPIEFHSQATHSSGNDTNDDKEDDAEGLDKNEHSSSSDKPSSKTENPRQLTKDLTVRSHLTNLSKSKRQSTLIMERIKSNQQKLAGIKVKSPPNAACESTHQKPELTAQECGSRQEHLGLPALDEIGSKRNRSSDLCDQRLYQAEMTQPLAPTESKPEAHRSNGATWREQAQRPHPGRMSGIADGGAVSGVDTSHREQDLVPVEKRADRCETREEESDRDARILSWLKDVEPLVLPKSCDRRHSRYQTTGKKLHSHAHAYAQALAQARVLPKNLACKSRFH